MIEMPSNDRGARSPRRALIAAPWSPSSGRCGRAVRRSLIAALLSMSGAVVGCGGGGARHARPEPRTRPPEEPSALVFVLPGFGMHMTFPGRDDANRSLLTLGGSRVQLATDGATSLAPDALVYPIVATSRTDRGWLSLDRAGMLWRASDFVGDLESVGAIGVASFRAAGQSVGALAVIDGEGGDAYVTDGSLPARRLEGLPRGGVVGVAFADARRAVAVVDGGQLAMTDDGGVTWRALDTQALGRGVTVHDGSFVVEPADDPYGQQRWFVGPSGAVARRPRPDELSFETLGRALPGGVIESFPALLVPSAPMLADGRMVVVAAPEAGRDLLVVDLRSGRVETMTDALPSPRCRLEDWGGGAIAALCPRPGGARELYRSMDGRAFERVADIAVAEDSSHVLSLDGDSVIYRVQSEPSLGEPDEPMWIARRASGWQPERMSSLTPTRYWNLGDASGSWLVTSRHELRIARLPDGAAVTPRIPDGSTTGAFGLTIDGRLWVNVTEARGARVVLLGPPDSALSRIELPSRALAGAMRDAQRGIAVGRDAAEVWRTLDGGQRWEPLVAPVRGDPSHVRLLSPTVGETAHRLVCRPSHCRASGEEGVQVVLFGWGRVAPAPQRAPLVAAPTVVPDGTARRSDPPDPVRGLALACGVAPSSAPPSPQPAPGRAPTGSVDVVLRGGGGAARLVRAERGGDATWQLFWSGSDGRGRYEGATRASPAPDWLAPDSSTDRWRMVAVTRAGVVLVHLDRQRAMWAPRSEAILELPDDSRPEEPIRALDVDNRRAVVLVAATNELRLYDAGPTAVTLAMRRYIQGRRRIGALVRDASGQLTLAATSGDSPNVRVFPRASELPFDVPAAAPLGVCPGARDPRAVDVWLAEGPSLLLQLAAGFELADLRANVEVVDGAACIRSIDWWSRSGSGSARLLAGAEGRLTGELQTDQRRSQLRCAIQQVAAE